MSVPDSARSYGALPRRELTSLTRSEKSISSCAVAPKQRLKGQNTSAREQRRIGSGIARYDEKPSKGIEPPTKNEDFATMPPTQLRWTGRNRETPSLVTTHVLGHHMAVRP